MIDTEKPNILMIMADQMVPFLTGAYGHKVVKTPNLDMLAAQGVRFDAAYSPCPLCAPARAALMTGRYVSETGCYDNASPFSSDMPTIAHYFSREGYDCVLSGKMHFIGPDQLHGFKRRLTTDIYPSSFKWIPELIDKEPIRFSGGGHAKNYESLEVGVHKYGYQFKYDEETQFRALEYILTREDEKPFFFCVSFTHPHEPFHVSKELWDMYEGEEIEIPEYPDNLYNTYSAMDNWLNAFHGTDLHDVRKPESLKALRRSYYGLISYVDKKVGELLKALDDAGVRDNTIIIFTSDHGDMLAERGMVQKRCFYEWSSRIPLIISFHDKWKKGLEINEPVSLIDLLPTLLDIAGIKEENRLPYAGKSVISLIDGTENEERAIISEYHAEGVLSPCFMVRKGNFKYIYIHGEQCQLFNLQDDPGEWNNLSGKLGYKAIEDGLRVILLDRFDPEFIDKDVKALTLQRKLIKEAMVLNDTHWDYYPYFDATKQYVR